MSKEKDLTHLQHFCQLVYAKYMQMSSAQYLEQLSKGGPQALQAMGGGMPPMMNGFNPQMGAQMPMHYQQMPPVNGMQGYGMYPQQHYGPVLHDNL